MDYKFPVVKFDLFIRTICLLLIIISSGTIFFSLNSTLVNGLDLIILLFLCILSRHIRIYRNTILICFALLFSFMIHIKEVTFLPYVTLVVHLVFVQIVSKMYCNVKEFEREFIQLFTPIIIISIFGFFCNYLFYKYYSDFHFFETPPSSQYSILLFFFRLNDPDNTFRNLAFFWEPGIYSFYLSYYIYAIYNSYKLNTLKKITILIIGYLGILSTSSSAGYLSIIFFLLVFNFGISLKLILKSALAIISILILFYWTALAGVVNVLSLSSKARLYDIFLSLELIKNNFFLGLGYASKVLSQGLNTTDLISNTNLLENSGLQSMHERGVTTGILLIVGYFGVPLGLLLIFYYFKALILTKENILVAFLVFSLFTQPLFFTPFFYLIYYIRLNEKHSQVGLPSIAVI